MSSKKNLPLPQSLGLPFTGADSHAHLDDPALIPILPEVLARASEAGVSLIVHIFLLGERYRAYRQCILDAAAAAGPERAPEICFARGLHPEDVLRATGEEWEMLEEAVRSDPLVKAVGEIGLDWHYDEDSSPRELQEPLFRRQLRLAKDAGKPVVIHSRDAWERTLAILDEEGMRDYPLLWHCFGGNARQAAAVVENGWHIALGGASTYKANGEIRRALHEIPLDRLLFETDCPYLAPMPWRGRLNEPALTAFTAVAMAEELGMDAAELWTVAGDNARRFFGMGGRRDEEQ